MEGTKGTDAEVPKEHRARRLTGAEAFRAHATLLVGLALCGLAFWFELDGPTKVATNSAGPTSLNGRCSACSPSTCGGTSFDPDRQSRVKLKKTKQLAPSFTGMLSAWEEHQRASTEENGLHPDGQKRSALGRAYGARSPIEWFLVGGVLAMDRFGCNVDDRSREADPVRFVRRERHEP